MSAAHDVRSDPSLEQRLSAAAARLAMARQALAHGAVPDLAPLAEQLGSVEHDVARLQPYERRRLRPALLALLDDTSALQASLGSEQQRLQGQLRAAGTRQRADAAYRRSSR